MFYLNDIATIAVCIGGIIVGSLALRRHKTAACLMIVGWSLLLIITSGWLLFSFSIVDNFFPSNFAGSFLSIFMGIVFPAFSLAARTCVFLGIYLLLGETTSQKKFFSLKYKGLQLRPEKEYP